MKDLSANPEVADVRMRSSGEPVFKPILPARGRDHIAPLVFALVALASFALYWLSSFVLEARHATTHFGADAHHYTLLAGGNVVDRAARFHPVTVAAAMAWMTILKPLTLWIAPLHLLKAMFAVIGAASVWSAMSAFATSVPRNQAAFWGAIYAVSFGIWFFSSIEESKIVTTSLSALYIASYLRLRQEESMRGRVFLTLILILAGLNEIVSYLLVVIPVVDMVLTRGWDVRRLRWLAAHALTAPIALAFLEGVVNGWLVPVSTDAESKSHLSMFFYYVFKNDHSAASLYSFIVHWLFFNIAAPARDVLACPGCSGHFAPSLANYLASPVSIGLVALSGVTLVAIAVSRHRTESSRNRNAIMVALMAYALFRGAFFFLFNPPEPLLFSSAITLAHLLIVGMLFADSNFPAKRALLGTFAILLLMNNGAFIFRW